MPTNIGVIKQFAVECNTSPRNLDAVATLLHNDVLVREAPSLPYGGDHHGVDGFMHVVDAVDEYWEVVGGTESFQMDIVEIDAETVLMRVDAEAIARSTGTRFLMRVVEFFTVRDGKIAMVDVHYWDTAAMCQALSAGS
jgi:uncharacterized protein